MSGNQTDASGSLFIFLAKCRRWGKRDAAKKEEKIFHVAVHTAHIP